jgi:hypothetical protein
MMAATRPPRRTTSNVVSMPDRVERRDRRQPARPSVRRDVSAVPLLHYAAPYRLQDSASYDAAIVMTWRQHVAGAIDWDTAGRRHHALIEARDGRPVVA